MELKEFIKTAIADIVDGVKEAGESLKSDVVFCYHTEKAYNGYPSVSYSSAMRERQAPMTIVNFKVQVQVVNEQSAEGNVKGGFLNVIGGGIDGEVSHTSATTQELSFSIPMVWKKKQ